MEEWRAIEWNTNYEVSSLGRVRFLGGWRAFGNGKRYAPAGFRSLAKKRNGYIQVTIDQDHKPKNFYVHRLVAMAFIENQLNLPVVNHIDGHRENNTVDNLEWVTHEQNTQHAMNAFGALRGEKHSQARLTTQDVAEIRQSSEQAKTLAPRFGMQAGYIREIQSGRARIYG